MLVLPKAKVRPADMLQLQAAAILTLVELDRSKHRGHDAQCLYCSPASRGLHIYQPYLTGLNIFQQFEIYFRGRKTQAAKSIEGGPVMVCRQYKCELWDARAETMIN